MFQRTQWAGEKNTEAEYAKRLAIAVALYRGLIEKTNRERAFETMRRVLVPAGVSEMLEIENTLNASDQKGMDKLMAFWCFLDQGGGLGQVNQGKFIKQDGEVLHYQMTGCFFARFYQETEVPELTRLMCESDREYFPQSVPEFKFHRGDSWENTIAYGKDVCEYVYERKETLS